MSTLHHPIDQLAAARFGDTFTREISDTRRQAMREEVRWALPVVNRYRQPVADLVDDMNPGPRRRLRRAREQAKHGRLHYKVGPFLVRAEIVRAMFEAVDR